MAAIHIHCLKTRTCIVVKPLYKRYACYPGFCLQAPVLGQHVQKPAVPGGWWTGLAALLALYCIYEQISFAASRSVIPNLPCYMNMRLVAKR